MNVAKLFEFSSIAIIGASPRNDIAVSVLDGLESIGFSGEVACINPGAESVRGRPAYRSIEDVPFEVDHAVIDIRADRVPAELEKCGRQGVRAVTIHSGGFLEVGDDGIALQLQLAEIAARFGMILCGPNCMGWMSAHDRTAAYCKSRLPNVAGGVGVVAHSGGVLNEILNYGSYRGIAFSKAVSTGNEAVCDVADFLEHLVHDPATTTIGLVLEGVRSPERLWPALALALERGKPVVAIKIGSSKLAAAAAAMHTGADVGSYDEFVAQCETYGVTLVHDIDQLCEALLVFSNAGALVRSGRPPRGVAVIEISGGGGELVCDIAERALLDLAPLQASTVAALSGALAAPSNPLDLSGSWEDPGSLPRHEASLTALAADGGFDVVLARLTVSPQGEITMLLKHGSLMAAARSKHPDILFAALSRVPDPINPQWRDFIAAHGLVYVQGYERGLTAIAQLQAYQRFRAPRA